MATWVQGQREVADAVGAITWMELLYRRLTDGFDHIATGQTTQRSEAGLGLAPHTYFYVERPHPLFGECVVAFAERERGEESRATPFDTGGLWTGHIATREELSADERRALVKRWSMPSPSYEIPFDAWVAADVGGLPQYRVGARPTAHLVEVIDLESCSDQAWTWEARVPKYENAAERVRPSAVFMMDGRTAAYLDWLRDTRWLDGGERTTHLQWIAEHVVETANPVDEMIRYLNGM